MAENLSDLQKAALDFLIEQKKVDDSFIGDIVHAFEAVGNGAVNAVNDAAHAVVNVANDAIHYVQQNPVNAAAAALNVAGRVAQIAEAGGAVAETAAKAPAGAAPTTLTLEDLIRARHGNR